MSQVIAELLNRLAIRDGDRLLDVAAGPGWVGGGAATRGAHVVGVDISRSMVELGAYLYPEVSFVQADAEALPFASSYFDIAVSNLGLSHVAHPARMVSEMTRVTRPGGSVTLTTHAEASVTALVGLINDAIGEVDAKLPAALRDAPSIFHHGFPGDERFSYLLDVAGLRDVAIHAIALTHLTTTADLWDTLTRGSSHVSLIVESQSEATRCALKVAFARLALQFGSPDRIEIPISIKLATGTKPESSALIATHHHPL